jgi:hypothetical protein
MELSMIKTISIYLSKHKKAVMYLFILASLFGLFMAMTVNACATSVTLGDGVHSTLQAAIDAAGISGDITLVNDFNEPNPSIINNNLKIDLGGYKLTINTTAPNALTVNDVLEIVNTSGTFNDGLEISGSDYGVVLGSNSSGLILENNLVTIEGGKAGIYSANPNVFINGNNDGELVIRGTLSSGGHGILMDGADLSLTVDFPDAFIEGDGDGSGIYFSGAGGKIIFQEKATVKGGDSGNGVTFESLDGHTAAIESESGDNVNIHGGLNGDGTNGGHGVSAENGADLTFISDSEKGFNIYGGGAGHGIKFGGDTLNFGSAAPIYKPIELSVNGGGGGAGFGGCGIYTTGPNPEINFVLREGGTNTVEGGADTVGRPGIHFQEATYGATITQHNDPLNYPGNYTRIIIKGGEGAPGIYYNGYDRLTFSGDGLIEVSGGGSLPGSDSVGIEAYTGGIYLEGEIHLGVSGYNNHAFMPNVGIVVHFYDENQMLAVSNGHTADIEALTFRQPASQGYPWSFSTVEWAYIVEGSGNGDEIVVNLQANMTERFSLFPGGVYLSTPAGIITGGVAGSAYSGTIMVSPGSVFDNISNYELKPSVLPISLSHTLNAAGNVVITGTPTVADIGVYTFIVDAEGLDSSANNYWSAPIQYILAVSAMDSPVVSTPGGALAGGVVGSAYNTALTATNNPDSWAVYSGSLPAGLLLDTVTGVISGLPAVAGTSNFSITASNAAGTSAPIAFSISINAANPPVILTPPGPLPAGVRNLYYEFTLDASGGGGPLSWTISAGALPSGLGFDNSAGKIFGFPDTPGTYTFDATAGGAGGTSATAAFTIVIAPEMLITNTAADALFVFDGFYSDLARVILNGKDLTLSPVPNIPPYSNLTGYPGYVPVLGKAEEGSVVITLYKEFLASLPDGVYSLEVVFSGGFIPYADAEFRINLPSPPPPPPPPPPPGNGGSSSGGRGSASPINIVPIADPVIPAGGTDGKDEKLGENPARGLLATPIETGVKLEWPVKLGNLGFRVYRSESADGESRLISKKTVTGNIFIDANTDAGATYYYTLRVILAARAAETLGEPLEFNVVTTFEKILGEKRPGMDKHFILMKPDDPKMSVDGVVQEIDPGRGTTPIIYNGRTLMPIRAVVESMGGAVGWDEAAEKITLDAGDHSVIMWLDKLEFLVNGESREMDVAPFARNDRTMVPIRFAAENIGCAVEWLNTTQEIVVVFYAEADAAQDEAPDADIA